MTTETITAEIHYGHNKKTVPVQIKAFKRDTGGYYFGYAEGVSFSYRFRTGTKLHTTSEVRYDAKKNQWYVPGYRTEHNRHCFFVGLYDEKYAALEAKWYPGGRQEAAK